MSVPGTRAAATAAAPANAVTPSLQTSAPARIQPTASTRPRSTTANRAQRPLRASVTTTTKQQLSTLPMGKFFDVTNPKVDCLYVAFVLREQIVQTEQMRINVRIVRSEVAAAANRLVAHKELLVEQKVTHN